MIVPGGGISLDGTRWVRCKPGFLLPVRVLSRLFRRLFLTALADAHAAGRLRFLGEIADLCRHEAFAAYLAPLRRKNWFVYAKPPFAGPQAVLAYLARYTHRAAIANSRLMTLDERGVTFGYKDYRRNGQARYRTMTLAAGEFIRRCPNQFPIEMAAANCSPLSRGFVFSLRLSDASAPRPLPGFDCPLAAAPRRFCPGTGKRRHDIIDQSPIRPSTTLAGPGPQSSAALSSHQPAQNHPPPTPPASETLTETGHLRGHIETIGFDSTADLQSLPAPRSAKEISPHPPLRAARQPRQQSQHCTRQGDRASGRSSRAEVDIRIWPRSRGADM